MRKLILIHVASIVCLMLSAQSADQNYIKTETMTDSAGIGKVTFVQYYDGLGRPTLNATNGLNLFGKYVYSQQTYDQQGRESEQWLPSVGSTSPDFVDRNTFEAMSQATYDDSYAYTTILYNCLGLKTDIMTAGDAWHTANKGKHIRYITNTENSVAHYEAPLENTSLVHTGSYPAGALIGEETEDEDGHKLLTFRDMMGRVVLERRNGTNNTYFVYNDLGQLRYVLSPQYQYSGYKADYGYEYRYDAHGRMVKKILPGCEYIQYWYDRSDRLTFLQDATLRSRGLWRFMLYDQFGRLCVQGTCSGCKRSFSQGYENPIVEFSSGSGGLLGTDYILKKTDLFTNPRLEVVNYYDNYLFQNGSHASNFSLIAVTDAYNATGFLTGTINVASNGEWLYSTTAYGQKGQILRQNSTLLHNYNMTVENTHTFTGQLQSSVSQLRYLNSAIVTSDIQNNYDVTTGLLTGTDLSLKHYLGPERTAAIQTISYDSLGRVRNIAHSGNAGQTIYTYNLHGWQTFIYGKGFWERLHYTDGHGTPYYCGNISSQEWKVPSETYQRGYKFYYDGLNRLTEAAYGEREGISHHGGRYDEKVLEYTSNGAITRFQRRGLKDDGEYGKIDNLKISLDGNQVASVTEYALPVNRYEAFEFRKSDIINAHEYTYNGVGALVSDANRGIAHIEYDNLNYPREIQFTNGHIIRYVYAPDGTKLRTTRITAMENVIVPLNTTLTLQPAQILSQDSTEYFGNVVLENGIAAKYLYNGGYATLNNNTHEYALHYYTKDHLGNNRVVVNEDGTVEQTTHYYPFGGVFADAGTNSALQPYKYNGKELDRTHGLDTYDYGARQYYAPLLIWDRVDPLCEKYYHLNPYAYCGNNPVNAIDKEGKYISYTNSSDGLTYIYYKGNFYHDSFVRKGNSYIPIGNPVYVKPIENNLMYQTLQSLRLMASSKDANIKMVFDKLSDLNSGKEHNIIKGNKNRGSYTHPIGGGNTITLLNYAYDKEQSDFKNIGLTYYELIGHELKHAYDMENHKDSNKRDKNGVKYDEYNTVNFENRIRKEEENPERNTYNGYKIPNEIKDKVTIWK